MGAFEIWGHGSDVQDAFTQHVIKSEDGAISSKATERAFIEVDRVSGVSARKLADTIVGVADGKVKLEKIKNAELARIAEQCAEIFSSEEGAVLVIEPAYVEKKRYKEEHGLPRTRASVFCFIGTA